ncbi:MAG: Transcription-repair coupling factor [uncultured Thiotrichaceae bacterium]|uniref:Transcription-repair-coupling factor n=1 Tax=uncultured Thiotrichaceae bacterium TaxID=298394 RepID=A0A6S6U6H0_9GAMM|nr:MAG: Transcription-repair coupling factor [uncultured Thiotrichaceae bacterium]
MTDPKTLQAVYPPPKQGLVRWGQLYGSSQEWLIAQTAGEFKGVIVLVTTDTHTAHVLQSGLQFFDPSLNTRIFPDWETLPYDLFSPHEDIISERLKALAQLPNMQQGVLIVPVTTLVQRIAPVDYVQQHSLMLNTGMKLNIDSFRKHLEKSGYRHTSQVMEHGEYATRGALIDLFPMGSTEPYRIDLFDDEIETIRSFSPETQRTDTKMEQIELLPAREFPLDETGIQTFRSNYRTQIEGDITVSRIYNDVSKGNPPTGIEYYLPLFFEKTASLFDYLPGKTLIIQVGEVPVAVESFWDKIEHRYEERRHDIERPILPPANLYISPAELQEKLNLQRVIHTRNFEWQTEARNYATRALPSLLIHARHEQPLMLLHQFLKDLKGRVLFTAESPGRREALISMLRDNHLHITAMDSWQAFMASDERMAITVAPLEAGFWHEASGIAVVPENLLHGEQVKQKRRRSRPTRDADAIIRNLTDLNEGAPVVHEEHGIGRYLGMQTLATGDITSEYLMLEYAGGDKLYVPVASLHLVSRYTGMAAENAPMHKLGSEVWDKSRKKAAEKAHDVAAELLEVHARRAAQKGQSFILDESDYRLFAGAFPFEETPDQALAIESVITDMQSERPMDRVVCGDVGFGKTEVAMRAAFVAANAGKQVAMIAPTTLLVQQHLNNFMDRFADWPFRIESISRFKTPSQLKKALASLASGQIDILIGTHKLLQPDVVFKNLGIVIIDEEHRFGVRHKEQLKKLRANVDMLTMTATPIPRTLNMSLSGLRDLSIIATPPVQRHAIKTFVSEWRNGLVQEACAREVARGGQVYVLHNEVKSIEKMANDLSELMPDINVRFAHGQMRERELETIMQDFYHQRFQILVSTTIIESGIDVPTANTIIINRADKLGLAQLHQLRGRVGRSHHRAYAYLITPPKRGLSIDAKKRLEAIESLEDLGVGFTLATHDLEIRGAGELLGDDQSGQIQEIGFTLYNELLERAVKALKSGQMPDLNKPLHKLTTVDLGSPALIPEDYLPDVHSRLILYKRIASAPDDEALHELRIEMIDRFGLFPTQVQTLFASTKIKLAAQEMGIRKLDMGATGGRIVFDEQPKINPAKIIELIQKRPWEFKLDGQDKLRITKAIEDADQRVEWLLKLLKEVASE